MKKRASKSSTKQKLQQELKFKQTLMPNMAKMRKLLSGGKRLKLKRKRERKKVRNSTDLMDLIITMTMNLRVGETLLMEVKYQERTISQRS